MRDDELLAIYGFTRQLAEGMTARDAELKQSTAALEATIAQVRQLPAMLGQQTSKYIAAGIREIVQEDFKQPIEKAIEGPIRSIEVAAYHAREAVGHQRRRPASRPGPSLPSSWLWASLWEPSGLTSSSLGRCPH